MKIYKFILSVLIIVLFVGCSNLSKNTIERGTMPIRNGVFSDKTWQENLIFNRYSWYHELTMQFELMEASLTPQSGFNFWFSRDELESFNKCQDARIVLAYTLDNKIIPFSSIYDQFEKNGYSRFELIEFKKNLLQHPDSIMNSLKLYHVFGICKKTKDLSQIKITLPGYLEKTLN